MKKGINMNKKIMLVIVLSFISLISLSLISALGVQRVCLAEDDILYYSECNSKMSDYVCDATSCQQCVNEVAEGIYCPPPGGPSACDDIGECIYINDEPDDGGDDPDPEEDAPVITLISPDDSSSEAVGEIDFEFDSTYSFRLDSCELVIDDTAVVVKDAPIKLVSNTLTYSLEDGIYDWKLHCIIREQYGGGVVNSELRTLVIGSGDSGDEGDQSGVILVSPEDGYSATDTQTLDFVFNIEGTNLNDLTKCDLVLNNDVVDSITEINTENTISYSVSPASYTWKIDCLDNLNQTISSVSRSFVIEEPGSPPSGGGGGGSSGGGGGGGGGGSSSSTYTLSASQLSEGMNKRLSRNDKFKVKVLNETHYVKVDSVSGSFAKITVSSDPQTFNLYIGMEEKVDVNNDKIYDLSVKLNEIKSNKANITLKGISEPMEVMDLNNEEEVDRLNTSEDNSETSGITGAVIGGKRTSRVIIAIVFVLILVLVALGSYSYKKKGKN
jgi:hypothetical protein